MDTTVENAIRPHLEQVFERQRKRSLELRHDTIVDRLNRLRKLESWIQAHRERIKEAVHKDFMKPLLEVDTSEIYPVLTELRHTIDHLDQWMRPKKIDATLAYVGTRSEIQYEPKGVCLIIAPWNFPFNLCLGPLVSCIAAGNTAVIKPSELTPNTSRFLKVMMGEIFEQELVAVVEGAADISQALLDFPFDHIFFTGSPAVGKLVMKAASRHLSSVTLELGGKSPTIIDSSANLNDAAKRIAFGKFLNNGQTCIAPDYVLIEESVKEEFVNKLRREIQNMFGDGNEINEQSTSYARIVNAKHFHRVNDLLKDAIERGVKVEQLGPINPETNFMAPVILVDAPSNSKVMEEEIFGPLLPVVSFVKRDRVLEHINQRPKPLAMYIFTKRRPFIEYILQNTSAGGVCINECVLQFTHPNLPFGGVNNSGIGKSHGYHGFLAFSNEKPVLRQKSGWSGPYLLHPPYSSKMKRIVDVLLRWF